MRRREFIKSVVGSALLWKAPACLAFQAPFAPPAPDPGVKRVLVMFKCHFDAGFVDTQTAVVNRYFKEYFPRAMDLASQLRQSGDERYVWTTGSWLLYEYLEQATPEERTRMEKAISAGDIAWHALPFTWQTELMDASMISGGIGLSQALDRRFGKTTTGAKMTDVPGHTRGLIAPLAAQGVKFLDIGVNEASTPPEVPPLFLWKDPGGASLVVMYHHGYGGVVRVPDSDLAVAMVVRDDNSGPHTLEEIHQTYAHSEWPVSQRPDYPDEPERDCECGRSAPRLAAGADQRNRGHMDPRCRQRSAEACQISRSRAAAAELVGSEKVRGR